MVKSNPGVRRPILYLVAAIVGVALAVPLAVSSGQMQTGGLFDECFEAGCDGLAVMANVDQ